MSSRRLRVILPHFVAGLLCLFAGVPASAQAQPSPATQPTPGEGTARTAGTQGTPGAQSSVEFTIKASGLAGVSIDGRQIVPAKGGGWWLTDPQNFWGASDDQVKLGQVLTASVARISPTQYSVVHNFKDVQVTSDYEIKGEDLFITAHVFNHSPNAKTLKSLAFSGLTLDFGEVPKDARLADWFFTYLQKYKWSVAHPSLANPLGAWMIRSSHASVGLIPRHGPATRDMFLAAHMDRPQAHNDRQLIYLINQEVPAGKTGTCTVQFRFSANADWHHLLEPYKDVFQKACGPVQYTADCRPLYQCVEIAGDRVSRANPYGFMSDDCRFDLDNPPRAGVTRFLLNKGNPMAEAGAQACIFWGLQGWSTRGAMYRPDFDQFPDRILAHVPTIVGGLRARGVRAGLLARPAEIVVPVSATEDRVQRIYSTDPIQMAAMWNRFDRAIDMGFTEFYLDSFGTDPDDVNIMRQLREHMIRKGVDIPTYTEFTFDELLPYSGFYTELHWDEAAPAIAPNRWMNLELVKIFQWLEPGTIVIAPINPRPLSTPDMYRRCYQASILPLQPDFDPQPAMMSMLSEEFVDPVTHWWKNQPRPQRVILRTAQTRPGSGRPE